MTLTDLIALAHSRLDVALNQYIVTHASPASTLQKAMTYALFNGGKRVRPLLVYLTGKTFNAPWENLDTAACAVECIHVYSLIHDDLPAMDNADMRRGQPSCHKAFDEATAILAGDALQSLAFEILSGSSDGIKVLSKASGMQGMAAGQMLDIEKMNSLDSLTEMYRLKTGALLNASVQLGAIFADIRDPKIFEALSIFAENIGLAFQIQDDLLDIESTSSITGKPQRMDETNHKITYPSLLGVEESRKKVATLFETAIHSLSFLGEKNKSLCEFAGLLMQRRK